MIAPLSSLAIFALACFLLLILPGPAVTYIVTRSAAQGRTAGLVSVLGIHVGTMVHVLAAVLGLSAVIVASATAFTVIKVAGAIYLVYLGVRAFFAPVAADERARAAQGGRSLQRVFVDGIVLNILNPKTAVFFLAFVPQFVDVNAGNTTSQLLILGMIFIGIGILTDGAYALAGSWIGGRLSNSPIVERRKNRTAGLIYVGLGAVTAFSGD